MNYENFDQINNLMIKYAFNSKYSIIYNSQLITYNL